MDIISLQFAKARPWSFTAVAYDIRRWCEIFYDWLRKESLSVNILHLISSYIQRKIIKNGLNVNLRFKSSGMWYYVSVSSTQNFEEPYHLYLWGQAVQKKICFVTSPITRHHIPEDLNLQQHHGKNLKSHALRVPQDTFLLNTM
jgi:hypothetical protein